MLNFLARVFAKPEQLCRWCRKVRGTDAPPLPVCRECFVYALAHCTPATGDVWHRLMEEFRPEAKRWVKSMQTELSPKEVLDVQIQAHRDVLELRRQAFACIKNGQPYVGAELEKLATEQHLAAKALPALVANAHDGVADE